MAEYRYATRAQWYANGDGIPEGVICVEIPEGFEGVAGAFPYKVGVTTRTRYSNLPYSGTSYFTVPGTAASGSFIGPSPAIDNYIPQWDGTTGTRLKLGVPLSTFATAAQGATADTALQPGDALTQLSPGVAGAGTVPTSDGLGAITWSTPAGAGDVVGPASSTDNALVRMDGTTGKVIQNSSVLVGDTGAVTGLLSLNGNTFPAAPGTLATIAQVNAATNYTNTFLLMGG